MAAAFNCPIEIGAGNRVRTGDLNLGKVALYQLSYSRPEYTHFARVGRGIQAPPERTKNRSSAPVCMLRPMKRNKNSQRSCRIKNATAVPSVENP